MIGRIVKRDGKIVDFKLDKITTAIYKALKATDRDDYRLAEKLSGEALLILEKRYGEENIPSVEDIQDVVEYVLLDNKLYETAKAYILYRQKHKELRELKKLLDPAGLIEAYLYQSDWLVRENSNMSFSLQGLNSYIVKKVVSEYWLTKIYPKEITQAHRSGDFHIHDLDFLGAYTYYGKEVVIAKSDGKIMVLPFDKLYEIIDEKEEILNKSDEAYVEYPKNLYVLDKNSWTKVIKVVRKKKNRDMFFIKNRGGRSVIVTDNHPMITENGEKIALEVDEGDKTLTVDLNKLLSSENLFKNDFVDLIEEIIKQGWINNDKVYIDGIEIENNEGNNGYVHTISSIVPRKIKLTEKFGYFVGFTLAEGYLSYDEKAPRCVSLSQKDKKLLLRANEGLIENGMSGCLIDRGDRFELKIKNPFLRFLFEKVFKISPGAKNKTLPAEILSYNKDFVKGIIGGIIDGDGSIETSKTAISIRISSRALLEQLAVVMHLLRFTPRDRNIEGQGSIREYNGRKIVQNYPIYGISFRKVSEDLPSEKYESAELSTKAWQDEGRDEWHKIINKEKANIPDEFIYDITTESGTLIVNGMWNHNCVGWDIEDLLLTGFGGVSGKIESRPAKHFRAALGQCVNFFFTLQGESAGAQAFSNFDTYLSPFIRYDNMDYKQVKQALQEFLFNMNVPTRVGFQTPFTNITLDLKIPNFMKHKAVIIGGKLQDAGYGEFQREMDMFNRAFSEVMAEGDARGRPFTFPIPTYNITKDFEWDNENYIPIWEMTRKYGIPYFSNFVNSDMKPEDAKSMCCRLRLDLKQLAKRGGGLFGSNPLTGSIGVVTINMPRIAYLSETEREFFERLEKLMEMAEESLIIKRKVIEKLTDTGLYPYSRHYLRDIKKRLGEYWKNHFSTIGLIGMNEACLNFEPYRCTIGDESGRKFALRVFDFMREKLLNFQEEEGDNYNLEATPAEGTSYSLALLDKERFPDIISQGSGSGVFYTNSSQLPVNWSDDIFEVLDSQDEIQCKYTGGTVIHIFLGESLTDYKSVKNLTRKVINNYKLPYFTITPTFSICPMHGYIPGEHPTCPICEEEKKVKIKAEIQKLKDQLEQIEEEK